MCVGGMLVPKPELLLHTAYRTTTILRGIQGVSLLGIAAFGGAIVDEEHTHSEVLGLMCVRTSPPKRHV